MSYPKFRVRQNNKFAPYAWSVERKESWFDRWRYMAGVDFTSFRVTGGFRSKEEAIDAGIKEMSDIQRIKELKKQPEEIIYL